MLQVARLAPTLLGEAADLVAGFLKSQLAGDGGFKDRAGNSDLYYTVFGLEGLMALRADPPVGPISDYLRAFGGGESLDLVHAACLARCWAAMPPDIRTAAPRDQILRRIESFRSADGAYLPTPGSPQGTIYACFLALGTYQDLGSELPDPAAMLRCIQSLTADDGGYANQHDLPMGLTPPTAAAATLLRHLGQTPPASLSQWLLSRCHPGGGFLATPLAPAPDLLSTATALHALAGMQADFGAIKEPCIDFIDSLWTNNGGFYGNWEDDTLDCEYTYYALLALGHLSL
jgi:hypothetical protein